ncbi:MAG: exosome complex RNA-binding protein Csl4 [Aeropyrum sp.]|nr:exosome complex RNA-binding protein Csl4 [Aeropyrum sp.]
MPGDEIAGIEEFLPGEGVYVDEVDGVIRAAVVGRAYLDMSSRVAYVKPARKMEVAGLHDEVVGMVTGVRSDLVFVDIYGVVRLSPKPRWLYELDAPSSAAIPISQVADEYVKEIDEYYRLSDWIVGKIVSKHPPYTLTTVDPKYGVLYARCGKCGTLLEYQSNRSLKCPKCGNVEKRKVSALARSRLIQIRPIRNLVEYRYPW